MSRLWVLDHTSLSLWRRGHCLRTWLLSEIVSGLPDDVHPGDGATLLILSGTLQSKAIDVPPLSRRDQSRYLAQQLKLLSEGGCGTHAVLSSGPVIQGVHDAPGLVDLMAWFLDRGVRFRRIRHVAQLADVIVRCLREQPEHSVVGWSAGDFTHLCAVREGVTLWHRVLMPGTDLDQAFAETLEHLVAQSLFDRNAPVTRLWFGKAAAPSVSVDHCLDPDSLLRVMRRPVAKSCVLSDPPLLASVLSASHGDLRPAACVQQWRRALWVRGVTVSAVLICVLILPPLWQQERERRQQIAVLERATLSHDAVAPHHFDLPVTRQWVAGQHAKLKGMPVSALRTALVDIAVALERSPTLGLEMVAWQDTGERDRASLQVAIAAVDQGDRVREVAGFTERMDSRGWRLQLGASENQARDLLRTSVRQTLAFEGGVRASD